MSLEHYENVTARALWECYSQSIMRMLQPEPYENVTARALWECYSQSLMRMLQPEPYENVTARANPKYTQTNLSQCHFVHHKYHTYWTGNEAGLRGDRPSINFLNYAWFQASSAKWLRTALFWVITERAVVMSHRSFGQCIGLILEDQAYWSRNVSKKLPLLAA
jgi:hypothetical protein